MPSKGKKERAAQEANDFVDKLRRARHLNDGTDLEDDWNAQGFNACLKELSDELYDTPVHFIAEIVQNADDNTYAQNVVPALTLAYRGDGRLFVGCNEIGFEKENVKAICNIADSTKKDKTPGSGYIGEKGIGFKSVFKVANVVHISSGYFNFKFNRDDILGMIVPINAPFPETRLVKDNTRFCLQIPENSDSELLAEVLKDDLRNKVTEQMQQLSAEILLFLRRLRTINIIIADAHEQVEHKYKLSREDICGEGSSTITRLTRTRYRPRKFTEVEEMTVFRHIATDMPPEPKRQHISESEIVIAFPHPREDQAVKKGPVTTAKKITKGKRKLKDFQNAEEEESEEGPKSRDTFNFLAIRDYGFPFVLNADFILTSNRKDILASNRWNEKLRNETTNFFMQKVPSFGKSSILKFEWPRFILATNTASGTIMSGFMKGLRTKLSNSKVLLSQAGQLESPKELIQPRDLWKDDNGYPLLDDDEHLTHYVASQYDASVLRRLGIIAQTTKDCLSWLKGMSPENIQKKPATWHSKLATAIIEDSLDIDKLRGLKIVPLRDGGWVSGRDCESNNFCSGGNFPTPKGINCGIVADVAAKDPARRRLLKAFGFTEITATSICQSVIKRHGRITTRNSDGLDLSALVNHLWYLYKSEHKIEEPSVIKMMTKDEEIALASTLYMDAENGFKISEHFADTTSICRMIHSNYLARAEDNERTAWLQWLNGTLRVATLPRLGSQNGRLNPAFQHLIDNHPSAVWLTLLRDRWSHYFDVTKPVTPELYGLGNQLVGCDDGRFKPLREVYLRTAAFSCLNLPLEHLHFINLPDAEDEGWEKLSLLGVGVQPDLRMYLTILKGAADSQSSQSTDIDFPRLFRDMQQLIDTDQTLVATLRDASKKDVLIPIRRDAEVTWWKAEDCRWHVPQGVDSIMSIEAHYSTMQYFFTDILSMHDATLMDIMNEIAMKAGDESRLESLRKLLLALSDQVGSISVEDEKTTSYLCQILEKDIFPVKKCLGEARLASIRDSTWFVADRDRLYRVFLNRIWLLDYDNEHVSRLKPLFGLSLTSRFLLSRATIEEDSFTGVPMATRELTEMLRSKAKFLSLLVPKEDRASRLERMQNAHVYTVRELSLRRYVLIDGRKVYGQDEIGCASQDSQSEAFALNISESSVAKRELPWYPISEIISDDLQLLEDRQRHMLLNILTTSGDRHIQDALDREGFWDQQYKLNTQEEQHSESNGYGQAGHQSAQAAPQPSATSQSASTPGTFVGHDEDDEVIEPPEIKYRPRSNPPKTATASKHDKSTKTGGGSARRSHANRSTDGPPTYDESQEKQMADRVIEAAVVYECSGIQVFGAAGDDFQLPMLSTLCSPPK